MLFPFSINFFLFCFFSFNLARECRNPRRSTLCCAGLPRVSSEQRANLPERIEFSSPRPTYPSLPSLLFSRFSRADVRQWRDHSMEKWPPSMDDNGVLGNFIHGWPELEITLWNRLKMMNGCRRNVLESKERKKKIFKAKAKRYENSKL